MQVEELLTLRNELINTQLGTLLMAYMQDFITKEGCKPIDNSKEIKGMCQIVQEIKDIPKKVENIRSNQ